jgi:hypothetical protein
MFGLSLLTEMCPDGVELVDKPEEIGRSDTGIPVIASARPAHRVFRFRTDRRKPLHLKIKNLKNAVVAEFIDARDDKARAEFISEYGLLAPKAGTYAQPEVADYEVLLWQDQLAHLLSHIRNSKPADAVAAVNKAIASHRAFNLQPTLQAAGRKSKPQISFACENLLGMMLMEVGIIAAYGARTARCQHCDKLFLTGPFTSRRSTAKFCHRNCRQAALRERQKS